MQDAFAHLRQKAEQAVDFGEIDVSALSEHNIRRLIHNLEVHRIELEMQNEELQYATREAEEAKRKYLDLFEFAPVGYLTMDQRFTITEANLTFAHLLGFPKSSIVRRTFTDFICPDFQDAFYLAIRTLNRSKTQHPVDVQLIHSQDQRIWVHLEILTRDNGQTYFLSVNDMTRQKEAEQRYELLSNVTFEGILVYKEGSAIDLNASISRLTGYSREELLGTNLFELIATPEDQEKARRKMMFHEVAPYTIQVQRKDGSVFDAELEARNIDYHGEKLRIVAVRDVTKRKQADQTLRESEERLRAIFEQAAAGIAIALPDEQISEVNQKLADMLGYTREDLLQLTIPAITWPEDRHQDIQHVQRVIAGKQDAFNLEKRFLHKDGHPVWTNLSSNVVRDTQGQIQYAIGVVVDISEQKQTEQALQESEERLELALKGADLGVWDWFVQTGEVVFNARWADMVGYALEEIEPHISSWETLVHPDDMPAVLQALNAHLEGHTPFYEAEFRMQTKTGEWKWVLDRGKVLERDNRGKPVRAAGTHLDITDRKQAEIALKEALQEKEVLLQEIHHRVKNNMQTIASLLYKQRQYTDDAGTQAVLDDSMQRVKSMALIHEHIYRSRNLARINLAEYIRNFAHSLLRTSTQNGQEIALRVQADDVYLTIDRSIPVALILNELLTNALKYAFPDKRPGEIRIECSHNTVEQSGQSDITLRVADNGVGLPEGFDMTTTNTLGLYLVYNLVTKQLGGSVEIHSFGPPEFVIRFQV